MICLSHTWLTNDGKPFLRSVPGYGKIFSKCRMQRRGAVMTQVRQDLVVVKTLPSEFNESDTMELKYNNVRFKVAAMYNRPTRIKQDFLDNLDSFFSSFGFLERCYLFYTEQFDFKKPWYKRCID